MSDSDRIQKKMETRAIIAKFFIIASNLNKKIEKGRYFKKLSNNNENNYALFEEFARVCSNTLLCIMHKLGHCDNDVRLENAISRLVEARRGNTAFFENDAGGHIADFLRRNENREEERGKLTSNKY